MEVTTCGVLGVGVVQRVEDCVACCANQLTGYLIELRGCPSLPPAFSQKYHQRGEQLDPLLGCLLQERARSAAVPR